MPSIANTTRVFSRYAVVGTTTTSATEPTMPPDIITYFDLSSNRTDGGPVQSWRQKIANGESATSFLFGEKRTLTLQFGHIAGYYTFGTPPFLNYQWSVVDGYFPGSFVPNGIGMDLTSATNTAKMKFVRACLQELQSLEGGVFLGELGQTLRMIKNPAQALRHGIDDYYTALKRRRKGSKTQKRRVIAETWLEYSYGWKPLISDIEGGFQALQRFSRNPVRFKPVQASGSSDVDLSPAPIVTNAGTFSYVTNRKHTAHGSVRYQGAVDLQTGGKEVIYSDLGLRLDRFVPTLWELIPYSFLVDYFSNIGDIISSWAFGNSNLRWYYKSSRVESSYEHNTANVIPAVGQNVVFTRQMPCRSLGKHVSVDRATSLNESLIPAFRLEIPGMSSLKWLNLAALAQTRRTLRPF